MYHYYYYHYFLSFFFGIHIFSCSLPHPSCPSFFVVFMQTTHTYIHTHKTMNDFHSPSPLNRFDDENLCYCLCVYESVKSERIGFRSIPDTILKWCIFLRFVISFHTKQFLSLLNDDKVNTFCAGDVSVVFFSLGIMRLYNTPLCHLEFFSMKMDVNKREELTQKIGDKAKWKANAKLKRANEHERYAEHRQ